MSSDIQKASMWKRISAYLFDIILLVVLVTAVAFVLSAVFGYDGYNQTLDAAYAGYEAEYGIVFDISHEQYNVMTEAERLRYDEAYAALIADEEAMYAYNMVVNLTLVITTLGILLGYLVLEFAVPLFFGNGQTLGKKIFGIGLMRIDGVRITPLQLFVRTVLGKFTIETMIPVYVVVMLLFNTVGVTGTLLLAALLLAQIIILAVTRTNSLIHDLLAGTVAVDYASQRIFRTTEDLIEYKKRLHAEEVARKDY